MNELKERLIAVPVWTNFRQDIIDTATDQWRKRLQACNRCKHFEHLLWTNSCKQFACFHVVLVQVASVSSVYHVNFLLCWCL